MTLRMQLLHLEAERLLNQIAALFPPEYKLTLLARHPQRADCHVLLTVDDLAEVRGAFDTLAADHNVHASPMDNPLFSAKGPTP